MSRGPDVAASRASPLPGPGCCQDRTSFPDLPSRRSRCQVQLSAFAHEARCARRTILARSRPTRTAGRARAIIETRGPACSTTDIGRNGVTVGSGNRRTSQDVSHHAASQGLDHRWVNAHELELVRLDVGHNLAAGTSSTPRIDGLSSGGGGGQRLARSVVTSRPVLHGFLDLDGRFTFCRRPTVPATLTRGA